MHTFYYPDHHHHDPVRLHQPETPQRNINYSEVAQRGERIHQAIELANFGPIKAPQDFGLAPITDIHDQAMIQLLQTWHTQMGATFAIPDTFPVRHTSKHLPHTLRGLLGYYSFDVYAPIFEQTWHVAYWTAQTAVTAAHHLHNSEDKIAYALCRPPGHHAGIDTMGGFCYLNNAAIAANWLTERGQRVAIIDIDYHHGNGTQTIFYSRSDVLFCSIHGNPHDVYPYYWGFADEYGEGAGENYTFNFPLPIGTHELDYVHQFEQLLKRVRQYVPDMLLISLGVDAIEGDPLGGFLLQTASYRRLGEMIADFHLPTLVVQEGGYHLPTLGDAVVAFFNGLLQTN